MEKPGRPGREEARTDRSGPCWDGDGSLRDTHRGHDASRADAAAKVDEICTGRSTVEGPGLDALLARTAAGVDGSKRMAVQAVSPTARRSVPEPRTSAGWPAARHYHRRNAGIPIMIPELPQRELYWRSCTDEGKIS